MKLLKALLLAILLLSVMVGAVALLIFGIVNCPTVTAIVFFALCVAIMTSALYSTMKD